MARPSARTPQRRAAPGAGRLASASGRLRRPRHSRPEPGSSCPCRGSAWPPSGHSPGGRLMGADLTALPSGPRAPAARPPPPGRYGRGLCRAPVQPPLAPGGVFSGGPWLLSASSLLPGVAGCTLPRPQGPCPAPPATGQHAAPCAVWTPPILSRRLRALCPPWHLSRPTSWRSPGLSEASCPSDHVLVTQGPAAGQNAADTCLLGTHHFQPLRPGPCRLPGGPFCVGLSTPKETGI